MGKENSLLLSSELETRVHSSVGLKKKKKKFFFVFFLQCMVALNINVNVEPQSSLFNFKVISTYKKLKKLKQFFS